MTPSGQFGLEAYGLDNEYNTGGGWSLTFSPFTNTAWTRDEVVNLTVGWWGRWAAGSQTAWAQRLSVIAYPVEVGFQVPGSPASYSVSPPRLNLSTGDTTRFITTTASRSTVRFTPSFTIGSTSNPNSSCVANLSFAQATGTGSVNSIVTASPAGCSTIANNVRARVGAVSSTNSTQIVVPPQVMIKMLVGEAGGQPDDVDQHSILVSARNRFGDRRFPGGRDGTWQAVLIPAQYYGASDPTTNGPDRELRNAADVFTGTIGDIVATSKCYWSPTFAQWQNVQAAIMSGTTTFPTGTGAPDCFQSTRRQIVHKTSIGLNTRGGVYSNAPAFVFIRERGVNDPAVVSIP